MDSLYTGVNPKKNFYLNSAKFLIQKCHILICLEPPNSEETL